MVSLEFIKEIEQYSIDDLELILSTQKELYSEEEFLHINKILEQKKEEQRKQRLSKLPKEIVCPKCDGINSFETKECKYCDHVLDKSKYYEIALSEDIEEEHQSIPAEKSYVFQYIVSFLIPLIGFILGAIQLSKENDNEISLGKTYIVLGIVSIILSIAAWAIASQV